MRMGGLSILLALGLASCGNEAPAPQSPPTTAAVEAPASAVPVAGPERHILALGDSLFAGYRLGRNQGYPEVLEARLRAQGINAQVTNAGVSGDTTAAGRQRVTFIVDGLATRPDLAIVELGGNDLLRGIPPSETRANLAAILAELRKRKIPVLLMGMRAPPNLGADFVAEFDALYPALAKEYDTALVPFFLEAIYARPELNQDDRIHPTAEGVKALVAATADQVAGALPKEE